MNKQFIVLLFSFICLRDTFSQIRTYTLQLFYDINEIRSEKNSVRLDSLGKTLGNKTFNLKIYGYADFLHTDNYNLTLSQNRADATKEYLLQKTSVPQKNILECKGLGENLSHDNNSPEGEAYQRRVDIMIEVQEPAKNYDTRPIEIKQPPDSVISKNIEELEEGETIALEGLSFYPGRHVLLKGSTPVLERLLKTMQDHPKLKIEIQGHVCCTPGEDDAFDEDTRQKKLSESRAKAIYDYLVRKGIDPLRLKYKGYAHSRPRVPETSPENDQMNRRVEIMMIEK